MTPIARQYGPWPAELEVLVAELRYKPGWTFSLADIERDPADTHGAAAGGLTFVVLADTPDAYGRTDHRRVYHYFPVPAATYSRASWRRWLLDCLLKIETHEAAEFFRLERTELRDVHVDNDSVERQERHVVERPFAPTHGPGDDPYVVHEYADDRQRRTSFRGEVKSP